MTDQLQADKISVPTKLLRQYAAPLLAFLAVNTTVVAVATPVQAEVQARPYDTDSTVVGSPSPETVRRWQIDRGLIKPIEAEPNVTG